MADWEDDDFGGFESADIGDAPGTMETVVMSPGPPSATQAPAEGNSAQILDWILSNTPKADSSPQVLQNSETSAEVPPLSLDTLDEKSRETSLDSPASISHAEELKDRLNDSAEIAKNLDDIFANSTTPPNHENSQQPNWSANFSETQEKIRAAATEVEPSIEKTVDTQALQKLQAELDAALIMKEQTEKSMAKLQEELEELTEKRKMDLEKSANTHGEEMEKLTSQHKEEMSELQKISEETVKLVTKQYSDIWKIFEREKAVEAELTANSITEKCVELMKQQHEVLCQKIEENRTKREKELEEALRSERETMKKDIEKELEEGRKNLEKELADQLKEKMAEEAKKFQELHSETLKEAMTKQQVHFENVLQSTLSKEREKFSETLKDAVKEAQLTTEKAAHERQKLEEKRVRNHTMSVKMFLSSALQQLEQHFPNEEQQDAES